MIKIWQNVQILVLDYMNVHVMMVTLEMERDVLVSSDYNCNVIVPVFKANAQYTWL